ncbi:addiction module toxin RelE [Vibrio sinensis]|uniref:Addiction module toxin RelE n=1 Tax=Vibrio sinensis TaxID=2302434 RepID=A0A3A6R533_9VIBR|nr:addiction module toxin RelE [Vibrio sinensis]
MRVLDGQLCQLYVNHVYFAYEKCRFYLLTIYGKNEMSDLTADQKKQLKAFVETWRNEQS